MPCDILNDKIERHLQQYLAPALFLLRGKLTPSGVLLILSPKELVFVRHDSKKLKTPTAIYGKDFGNLRFNSYGVL